MIASTAAACALFYRDGNDEQQAPAAKAARVTKQESVVFKVTNAILISALIAAIVTILTSSSDRLDASPMPEQAQTAMKACAQQPWPYLNCVGTPYGNPRIRVIEIK